jgi:hypothetical protein
LLEIDDLPFAVLSLVELCSYDAGVFMYSKQAGVAPVVSPVQAYLDLYARGGRDLKQAEYLLNNVIQLQWRAA